MVQFVVGDIVHLCASIKDFCGQTSQIYDINDINISKTEGCVLDVPDGCLPFDGIEIIFQWTNILGTTETYMCDPIYNLKLLGSAITNSEGRASLQYTITEEDQTLFNSNTTFDLRACINNVTTYTYKGRVRSSFSHDNIHIGIPETTHIIKVQLNEWKYLNYIQQKITEISASIASKITPDPNINYIKSEYDSQNNTLDIHIEYTGPQELAQTVPGEFTILQWAKIIVPILIAVITFILVGIIIAAIAAGAVITITIIAAAIAALAGLIVTGYNLIHISTQLQTALTQVENLTNSNNNDAGKQSNDDALAKLCTEGKITNLDYIKGLKLSVVAYANKSIADYPLIEINDELNTYNICADSIIITIQQDSVCGIGQPEIDLCFSPLLSKIKNEISIKYGSGTFVKPSCDTYILKEVCEAGGCKWENGKCVSSNEDCWISKPLEDGCVLSAKTGKTILVIGGLAGLAYLYSKTKKK